MALGDTTYDDANYTGDTGDSALSVQFYRNKAGELQAVLNGLDAAIGSLQATLDTVFDDSNADLLDSIQLALQDAQAHKTEVQAAVAAINIASQGLNAVGVRFPMLTAPSSGTLGLAPIAIGAIAAAVALAASLIAWGVAWIYNAKQLQLQALQSISDPAKRDVVAAQIATTDQAAKVAASNPFSSAANIIKWGAIAVAAFVGWKMYSEFKSKGAH